MALNPVETMNVFDGDLSNELRERSKSTNLVRTRAPFLRFTTGAQMSDLATRLSNGSRFSTYENYQFFTLGMHGYENVNYSIKDLYGTQSEEGLVIGTTYKQGEQRLVKTFGGQVVESPAKNYPPPGIVSAKIERLRNGNVIRFIVETQCYTQEQLEMLDVVCYVPGMTCILEWGNIFSTTGGSQQLSPQNILDFKNTSKAIEYVKDAKRKSRTDFIGQWCKPNKFNYDWAVANIANVKTTLQNNVYKTTIIAYGEADNLMYISAYATNNPLKVETDQATSLTNYFKINGEFSNRLRQYDVSPELLDRKYRDQFLKFTDGYNRQQLLEAVPTSQETGQANDIGLEDSYFITFPFFIDLIINGDVRQIVNKGLASPLNRLIATTDEASNEILVGYNESLRSTSPEVLIIYNTKARTANAAPVNEKRALLEQASTLDVRSIGALKGLPNTNAANQPGSKTDKTSVYGVIVTLNTYPFGNNINTPSGVVPLSNGVWLNSKAIQSAFINARTFMEGMETLLRNINSATENYWDLKIFYDDDLQAFRILDDNVRVPRESANIYEFNRRLNSLDGDITGPDVLDIQLQTDYPKIFFSQLAITGINGGSLNNTPSSPDRKDVDFKINTSVRDIFATTTEIQQERSEVGLSTPSTALLEFATGLSETESGRLLAREGFFAGPQFASAFGNYFATGVQGTVANTIRGVFNNTNLLSDAEALDLKNRLSGENLTQQQSAAISNLFAQRAIAIVRRNKKEEIDKYEKAIDDALKNGTIRDRAGRDITNIKRVVREAIEANRDDLIRTIQSSVANVRP